MSDTSTSTDANGNENETDEDNIASLREAAKRGKASAAEAEQLRRELAFRDAGLKTDHPVYKLFTEAYKGNLDVEAIRAEAAVVGVYEAPDTSTDTELTDEERAEAELREQMSGGTPGANGAGQTPHPKDHLLEQFHEDRKGGLPDEMARQDYVAGMIRAAADGDKRAIYDPAEFQAKAARFGNGPR